MSAHLSLIRFCSRFAPLERPFNHGAWTFATDGRIVLRVPRMLQWMEHGAPPEIALLAFDHVEIPEACWSAPSAAVGCSGQEGCVRYGQHHVDVRYARMLFDLPEVRLAPEASLIGKPIRFKCAGGLGYVTGCL